MSIFMQYKGINDDVSNTEHQNWIDVQALSWGTARQLTSNSSTRGDRESSNAQVTELVIRRLMDKATPHLFLAACCGKGKDMVIHLTKTGAGKGSECI